MIDIHPIVIKGSWEYGEALDIHTLSSKPRPDGSFDTEYTPLGRALFRLKYRDDRTQIKPIVETVTSRIRSHPPFQLQFLKSIIPIPPSKNRPFQPVIELAQAIGKELSLPVPNDYLRKVKNTMELKDISDTDSRREQLQGAFQVVDQRYAGQSILLFDDLIRSGETLNFACQAIKTQGNVKYVYVIVLTKTRTKR
ncbi:MAG: hypothetical protein RMJ07_07230 [Nitrososphaerota archaeon]|nr:hypothetical protein [Nitrososphaerota archaeon]